MTAYQKSVQLADRIYRQTSRWNHVSLSTEDANTLRRAEMTLHRWAELECGDGDQWASWAIERDEAGKPWMCRYPHNGPVVKGRTLIADRENGALRRVEALCKRLGLYYYHQTDPRGCALYVASVPLDAQNYSTDGISCAV